MSQDFKELTSAGIIRDDRETINKNFWDLRSCSAGTAAPTDNLVVGMPFFNTNTKKLYRLMSDLATWTLEADFSSGVVVVSKAGSADEAGKASNDDNGKAITSYVAKLEQNQDNAFVINVYDGNNKVVNTITIPETKINIMQGATSTANGVEGLVPAPMAGEQGLFLRGDGTYAKAGAVDSVNGQTGDVTVGEITDASISGKEITLTFADGTTKTLTTQDTDTNNISASSLAQNGYIKFNNNLTIQWGKTSSETVTFPIAFSSACYVVQSNMQTGSDENGYERNPYNVTKTGFSVYAITSIPVSWIAVGK